VNGYETRSVETLHDLQRRDGAATAGDDARVRWSQILLTRVCELGQPKIPSRKSTMARRLRPPWRDTPELRFVGWLRSLHGPDNDWQRIDETLAASEPEAKRS